MKKSRELRLYLSVFLIFLLFVSCSSPSKNSLTDEKNIDSKMNSQTDKRTENQTNNETNNEANNETSNQAKKETESETNNKTTNDTTTEPLDSTILDYNNIDISADNEFIQEEFGFSFKYNLLAVDGTIHKNQFAEMSYISGDKAVVNITEPSDLIESPEEWIWDTNRHSEDIVYRNENIKLGDYPGYIVEFSWNVGGKDIRTINLKALKDGYFYDLIVTMNEEYVEDSRTQFDVVVDSFRLFDNKVDLEVLRPWKDEVGEGYPYEQIPLYEIKEVDYVFGKPFSETGRVTVAYFPKDAVTMEEADSYYTNLFQNTKDYSHSKHDGDIIIKGTIENYEVQVKITDHTKVGINVEVKKIN